MPPGSRGNRPWPSSRCAQEPAPQASTGPCAGSGGGDGRGAAGAVLQVALHGGHGAGQGGRVARAPACHDQHRVVSASGQRQAQGLDLVQGQACRSEQAQGPGAEVVDVFAVEVVIRWLFIAGIAARIGHFDVDPARGRQQPARAWRPCRSRRCSATWKHDQVVAFVRAVLGGGGSGPDATAGRAPGPPVPRLDRGPGPRGGSGPGAQGGQQSAGATAQVQHPRRAGQPGQQAIGQLIERADRQAAARRRCRWGRRTWRC
jgi:hypothetical protein